MNTQALPTEIPSYSNRFGEMPFRAQKCILECLTKIISSLKIIYLINAQVCAQLIDIPCYVYKLGEIWLHFSAHKCIDAKFLKINAKNTRVMGNDLYCLLVH